jgi:hypothetical protein
MDPASPDTGHRTGVEFYEVGAKFDVLVTTNEPLGKLHPAVTRPGRCQMDVEFAELPVEAANAWLSARGCATRARHAAVLAELYAALHGHEVAERPAFGFAA